MTGIYISSLLFLIVLVVRANSLRPGGKNVKTSYQRYYVYVQTAIKVKRYRRTCTRTCVTHFIWCWSYKTVCRYVYYHEWSTRKKLVAKTKPYYTCYSGWKSKYGYECTIPICTGDCQNGGSCTNPNTCHCPSGWTGSRCRSDIDECRSSRNRCSYKPGCNNTQGSYRCTCRSGYYLASDRRTCRDVNECTTGRARCGANTTCNNTQGSYSCLCNSGYTQNPHLTNSCKDIDECDPTSGVIHGCEGSCHNLGGSYRCSCPTGHYLATINGRNCTDHDECVANTDGCQHKCVNFPGGYNCTCYPGNRQRKTNYKLCEDINECFERTSGCAQICTNQIASFTCSCKQGYYLGSDSKSCYDVDECSTDTHNCQHNCSNTLGSYHCTCRAGFDLLQNGRNCLGRPCFPIYTPVNGIMDCSGYTTEHICHFTCSPGYDLIHSRNRTCNSSKVWTGENTKCKIIHCPTPTEPNNGFVYTPCETQFDSQCTVGCSRGYYVNGTNKITCDANGAWQPGNLTCREIKVCQPNPCLHGGICSSISSDHYSCDCTNTGYQGTDCGVGSIITPDFPTLTAGVPSRPLTFQASPPSDSITLTLSGRGLEFNPPRLVFQNGGSRHQSLTITAQRPGLHFIRYSLSGQSAGEFQPPQADAIFVRSKYSTTEPPNNEILTNDLPSGCHKQELNKCPVTNDVITAASTLPWVTFGPLTMTKGVVNIEVGATNVPLSLVGANLPNANQVSAPENCSENDGGDANEQYIKSRILVRSFLNAVSESLPNWLSISLRNNSSAGNILLSELTTRYLTGKLLQDADVGEGQLTRDDSFYSLLQSRNLNLTIDNDVDLLRSGDQNVPLSLAVDLCGPAPKTVIVRPSLEDMDVVNDNSAVKSLRENGWNVKFYSLQISKKKLIEKLRKGQFWNGERFFKVDDSTNGNLAMVSSFNKSFKSTSFIKSSVEFQGTIVADLDNIESILETPLDQEWKVDLYGNIAVTTEFKVKGKVTRVTVEAPQSIGYARFGGSKQKGCQTDANYDPQGLFLTTTLQEDPFVHSELSKFVELGSNKALACFLDTAIHTNKGSQLSNYAERNDGVGMAFHGHIKFGPLQFQNLDIQLSIRNSDCSKATDSLLNTAGVVLNGEPSEIRGRKFGIFELSTDLALKLRILVAMDKDSNSTGSFQSIAQILGFKKLTNVSFSNKGLNFAASGKVHGLFDASMKCSSSLSSWDDQIFTVAGQFQDNSVRSSNLKVFIEEKLNRYAVQVLKKATSRLVAVKETEQRAKDRLENVVLLKKATLAKMQRIRNEYLMAERELASARKTLAHFEQAAKTYSGDVDELKEDLDGLCEMKECTDVCQEGVVCTTCYHDIIGQTMGMCPATCLKTEQRRIPPYSEVALCERQKCTRIHNTNGLFKSLFGNFFGGILKGVLSLGITVVASFFGVPPPIASALGSGLVTILDTGRVDEALCSIGKGVVTGFIGGPSATKVFKELTKVAAKEAVKKGAVAAGRHGASFLVGKVISCQREQRDGSWSCLVVAVLCSKGRFQYEYEHTPYGCKKSCVIDRITKTIEKSCCSNLPCASFIVNITCVAENALCKQARKVTLDEISKTKANAANILKNLASARQNISYWKIKKQKEHIKLVSASRSLNASQDAVRSLERAYNVTVEARRRKLDILAKPLRLRALFDERQESLVMVKIEDIRFDVRASARRESTLLPIYITFMANGSRETLSTVLDFKRLNASLRSIAKEILSTSVGDLSSVSRKRRSVEGPRDSIGSDQRFLELKIYHKLCAEFTNYEQTLYEVVSSLQNLSSEARSLQQNLKNRNESSSFNISDVLTKFSVNETLALKLGVNVPKNVSLLLDHLNTDPELSEANDLAQEATKDGREPLHLAAKLLVYNWYAIMEDIFNESSIANECSGLEDCLKYTIDNLYEIYAEIELPRAPRVREHIKAIETKLAELTQSVGMSVDDAVEISSEILTILEDMANVNDVCANPPNITKHPEVFTEMGVGNTLSLTCNATGSALVYKWRFNGEFLQDQLTNNLLIKNTTVSHSGDYTCEVSNHIATDTSIPSRVIVYRPPSIIVQPEVLLSVALSSDASLECLAESSHRNITYQWWFKSVNATYFLALKNETFSYLNFAPMTPTYEGWYFCNVSNAYGYSISRTSFVKALYFSLPVPVATLSLSVTRMVQENETAVKKLNASSYRDIRSRISELLSSFGNLSTATPTIRNLHPVTCELRNSRSNKTRDNVEVCQWQFQYVGENTTSNSSVNDGFEVNARKVLNASLDVKQDVEELVNATNNGSLSFLLDNQTYFVEKHSLSVQAFFLLCPQRQTLVQKDFNCVDCPPGSYGKLDDNGIASCQHCPLGSYQTNSGQASCVKCPKGFTTVYLGTYDKAECKVICPPGHYGIITMNIGQCLICPVNTYQPMEGKFACLACPGGHVTNMNGTTDVMKCIFATEPTTQRPTENPTSMKRTSPAVMTEGSTGTTTRGGGTVMKSESEPSNLGLIVGVVAAIVVILLLGVLLLCACRRRNQNKSPNQQQAEPPSSTSKGKSSTSDWRLNKAYSSDEAVGDFDRENPLYDTIGDTKPPPYQDSGFDNPAHLYLDVLASEGTTSSDHGNGSNIYSTPRNFENPFFVELNNMPNKSGKINVAYTNMDEKDV